MNDSNINNFKIIKRRWPEVFDQLCEASPERVTLVKDGPQQTLLVEGHHITSSYGREKEAELQASLVPEASPEAWVYGMGLGDLPRALLQRKDLKKLHVVPLNAALARQSFELFDHTDWLTEERVILLTSRQVPEIRFPFAAVAGELGVADDASSRLRDFVVLELATPHIRNKFRCDDPKLQARLEANAPFLEKDRDVAELFGAARGSRVLVAAAGPTLEKGLTWIRRVKTEDDVLLIAVDAAVPTLRAAEICPDIVVSIDASREGVLRFMEDAGPEVLSCSRLVYFPLVHPDILKLWTAPRLAAYAGHPLYEPLQRRFPKGTLFSAGSVIHPAVDLAVRMEAAEVVLLGADFSFPGGRQYAKELEGYLPTEPVAGDWVLNGCAERVATAKNYRGFLRDLERYIARQPQVSFYNASLQGAKIEGTKYLEAKL